MDVQLVRRDTLTFEITETTAVATLEDAVDSIKIDGTFIRDITSGDVDYAQSHVHGLPVLLEQLTVGNQSQGPRVA